MKSKILRFMKDIQEEPPPMDTPILVTNGEEIVTCSLHKEMGNIYMQGHGFDGWEYEFNFMPENITHWMCLYEVE